MCSNTGSSACGCCESGGNGCSMWSSGLKKQQKRPRVPKRGPGVAELEKILREQGSIEITDRGNSEGFSSSCFLPHPSNHYPSSSLKSHPPTSPPSARISGHVSSNLPSQIPSAPKFDHLGPTTPPTMTPIYGNCGPLGRNGSGSGLVSPEQELFPMNLTSCKSKSNLNEGVDASHSDSGNSPSRNLSTESNPVWSYPSTIQKRNNHYPPPTMNQFLGTGTPASSGSLPIGLHNHREPPSNQSSYYNYTSRAPEEHKMVGMKRSHPSSLDNSLIPPSNFPVLPSFSNYNRPHPSSTNNESHGVGSFSATNECYRDAKWGSTLELSSRRFNSDIVVPHANFPPHAAPEVPPPPMHLFQGVLSKGNVLPCQVTEVRSCKLF
ncbi:hypothetical protein SESBI_34540 [Sesbania bispinosa]|nr:hypothetical protein SESBI_34540 [Sesbania bispinosa]